MRTRINDDRTYLRWNIQRGIAWIHGRGYHWFVQRYLPAIKRLEQQVIDLQDRELLSDAYYYVGDVYDFNAAPLAAIRAYRKSFAWDHEHAEALREIGGRYEEIGRYLKAYRYLQQALAISPNDTYAQADLEMVQSSFSDEHLPCYQKEDLNWKACEYLAQGKFTSVLSILNNQASLQACQSRMCVYGALSMSDHLIAEWQAIIETYTQITMSWREWFYIKDSIYNSIPFWTLFLQGIHQFQDGVWWLHDSLWEVVNSLEASPQKASLANMTKLQKRLKLYAQYQLARIHKDENGLRQLVDTYPNWPEAAQLLKEIELRKKR